MTNADLDPKEKEYWKEIMWQAPVKAIEKTEDTAKQLITLTSLLQGIYFAAISFSDIKSQMPGPEKALFIAPFLFWLPSLYFAIRAFRPLRRTIRTEPAETKEDYKAIRDSKDKQLKRAFLWLGASLIVLLVIIVVYLLVVPPPPPCP